MKFDCRREKNYIDSVNISYFLCLPLENGRFHDRWQMTWAAVSALELQGSRTEGTDRYSYNFRDQLILISGLPLYYRLKIITDYFILSIHIIFIYKYYTYKTLPHIFFWDLIASCAWNNGWIESDAWRR